jgi:hypothetical protein
MLKGSRVAELQIGGNLHTDAADAFTDWRIEAVFSFHCFAFFFTSLLCIFF